MPLKRTVFLASESPAENTNGFAGSGTICRHMSCQDVKGSKKLAAFGGRLGTSR